MACARDVDLSVDSEIEICNKYRTGRVEEMDVKIDKTK